MTPRLTLDALSLTLPSMAEPHPNKAPFRGVLTRVDEPSTRPPEGADGHCVLIPRAVAEAALPSLRGMPINCMGVLKKHDKTNIVGIIEQAHIDGNDVLVDGYLFEKNQPDDVAEIRRLKDQLGMSFEVSNFGADDFAAPVWTLNTLIFTGGAILYKNAAAYQKTAIAAQTEEETLMPAVDTILEDLRTLKRDVGDIVAARKDDADEIAARKEEDAAHAAVVEAEQAREDDDEDDAARHEAHAATLYANALKCREDAAKRHRLEAAARKAAADADGEAMHVEAAAHHEAEATRLLEAEATRQREAEARKDAASQTTRVPAFMQAMLEAMGYEKRAVHAAQDDDDDDMSKLFGMFLRAMVYPGAVRGKRRAEAAAHDDEAEDRALFRRLIEQQREKKGIAAERHDEDRLTRRLDRRLSKLEGAMGLITDTLKQQTGLLTDIVHNARNLGTDALRPGQGGPVRKTLAATGAERWLSQLEGGGVAAVTPEGKQTLAEIDAAFEQNGVTDLRAQMAAKLELAWAGKIAED